MRFGLKTAPQHTTWPDMLAVWRADVDSWLVKRAVLAERCAEIVRNPSEITTSTHLRFDAAAGPGRLAQQAAASPRHGLDLAIIQLPPPHSPAVPEPIAEALAPLLHA